MEKLPQFPEEHILASRLKTPYAILSYEKLTLGKQTKHLRKKLGLSQLALAKKLRTTQSVIARMETGKQNYTLGTLINLGFILGKKLLIKFQN